MFRRRVADRITRGITRPSLPPPELLANIQMTPFVSEYLAVGRRSATTIVSELALAGASPGSTARVLDFGCGSARTLRHIAGQTSWKLFGCDVDAAAIGWATANFPQIDFRVNEARPPLPYDDDSFDAAYAVSLFTHFSETDQRAWLAELQRIVRPSGLILFSTMGPSVIANFPRHATAERIAQLEQSGSLFLPAEGAFNASAAFHTLRGIVHLGGANLRLLAWRERGLDGFQDFALFRRLQ